MEACTESEGNDDVSFAIRGVPEGQTVNGKYNLKVLRKKKSWILHQDKALAVRQFIPVPEHTGFSPLVTFPCSPN
jgi:hypothetical protein